MGLHVAAHVCSARVCAMLSAEAGVDNVFRIGSGAQSWAHARAGCSRKQGARPCDWIPMQRCSTGARVALLEGTWAALIEVARERECCIMRVHEGLTAERTSPGRAQPRPDLGAERRMQVDRVGVRSRP